MNLRSLHRTVVMTSSKAASNFFLTDESEFLHHHSLVIKLRSLDNSLNVLKPNHASFYVASMEMDENCVEVLPLTDLPLRTNISHHTSTLILGLHFFFTLLSTCCVIEFY